MRKHPLGTALAALALLALVMSACGGTNAIRPAAGALVRAGVKDWLADQAMAATSSLVHEATGASAGGEVVPQDPSTAPESGSGDGAAASVGSFASDVAASDQAAATIRSCTGRALDASAEKYAAAFNDGDFAPALDDVFKQTLLDCLTSSYPGEEATAADVTAIVHETVSAATAQAVSAGLTPQEYYAWLKYAAASMDDGAGAVAS